MTKYNKIKEILTVFRNENNDARVNISIDEYINHNLKNLTFKCECRFKSDRIDDINFRMFVTSSMRYPSLIRISAMRDIDCIVKSLNLSEFSTNSIEIMIENLLECLHNEIETRLNTEKIFRKNNSRI